MYYSRTLPQLATIPKRIWDSLVILNSLQCAQWLINRNNIIMSRMSTPLRHYN